MPDHAIAPPVPDDDLLIGPPFTSDVQPQVLEALLAELFRLRRLADRLDAKNRELRERNEWLEIQALVPAPPLVHRHVLAGRIRSRAGRRP